MTVNTYQWTIERYHQAVDAGIFADQSLELLRGELTIMPPEREPHAYTNSEIGDLLRSRLGTRAKVREAHPVTLPNNSEPIPDLAIAKPLGATYRHRHPYPADIYWIIEIASTTLTSDRTLKASIYAEAGIPEYWIIDLTTPALIVMRDRAEGEYRQIETLRDGAIAPLAFPDLTLAVASLIQP